MGSPARRVDWAAVVTSLRSRRLAESLGLERNVVAISVATLLLTFGEELWKRFAPKYLEALGAPVFAIGLYGATRDLLDGVIQYPGGWIADHYGRRRALLLFIGIAALGYLICATVPAWPAAFVGLALALAWTGMASPVLFAVIGDSLPVERRTMGFAVQSILRRVPIVIAPAIGGVLLARLGIVDGVRAGLLVSIALAIVTALVVRRVDVGQVASAVRISGHGVWRAMDRRLKRLLLSDIFIRSGEGMADVFVVLYALDVVGISPARFGLLVGVQMITSILVYLPAANRAARVGGRALVVATFIAFAAFPLAVSVATGFAGLLVAFVIGGLREIGEPARKAMIVNFAAPEARARTVGLYYLVRSVSITPAALVGAALWQWSPTAPFIAAGAVAAVGLVVFVRSVGAPPS